MYFQHSPQIWSAHPELAAGAVYATGITPEADVAAAVDRFQAVARERLAGGSEAELPEIQAWRRTFSAMGLKPTQYRCASEALLRRFRKDGVLPRIHPVIDLCNAISLAFAVPVAVLDVAKITGSLEVRPARGDEVYLTFSGQEENPEPGEVIFADAAGRAHARRWTNRQSGHSAVRDSTAEIFVIAEAMHESAQEDVAKLTATVADELDALWHAAPRTAILGPSSPRFDFAS
ncbi:B3/B4 domain-containing protein [Sphaerisporangium fuscum]|uniref:B3/B4 domain-containing protein n=1 Tax=Sphaerisporangium fuscum TaxID=2835868 RepID=UPI001BDD1BA0|nr:phenylalanine--tRNA ligase beta subunit-related protein [Sphaerisporangium fuscum]